MPPTLEIATASPEETREVGRLVGGVLSAGDVVSLTGDLGAGKTTFVQGAALALGVEQPVLSPTFTLVRQYEGRTPILHMDVYRLDRLQDVLDLGFEEMLDGQAILFVEWGDTIEALLPEAYLQIEMTVPDSADERRRRLRFSAQGGPWARRWDRIAASIERWART
jgi:tRNA threonylcarbamoyladenosine biosynthesis protein TsaE